MNAPTMDSMAMKGCGRLFEARGQDTEVFDFEEEAPDDISLATKSIVAFYLRRVCSGREKTRACRCADGSPSRKGSRARDQPSFVKVETRANTIHCGRGR
jgi:hypothetical protein